MSDMDQLNAMLDNLPFNLSDLNISVPFGKLRKINEETKQLKVLDSNFYLFQDEISP